MLTEKDLNLRKTGIGGSDVAKICGVSKYGSPLTVYNEKKGLNEPQKKSIALELGTLLESWISQKYQNTTGNKVTNHPPLIRHKKYDFMIGNVDGIIEDKNILLEIKTERNRMNWGQENSNHIPFEYLCQVTHYLSITNLSLAHIFVFFKDIEEFGLYEI
ncbi:MAG: lambda-exonuclease family protein, partial [Candidatus Thorarchaeota archaeon]